MITQNYTRFQAELAAAYARLFETPEYAFAASRHTPDSLATKMTSGLIYGTANHDGDGIKAACRACGIRHTRKEIVAFLKS